MAEKKVFLTNFKNDKVFTNSFQDQLTTTLMVLVSVRMPMYVMAELIPLLHPMLQALPLEWVQWKDVAEENYPPSKDPDLHPFIIWGASRGQRVLIQPIPI